MPRTGLNLGENGEEPTSPEDSLIRRAGKGAKGVMQTNEFDWVLKLLAAAAVAYTTSAGAHKVGDVDHEAKVNKTDAAVLELRQSLQDARDGFRQYADVTVKEEERDREQDVRRLERRLTRIEALLEQRLGMAPPPAEDQGGAQ